MFVTMNIDYRKLGKLSPLFLIGSIGLLVLVLVPGVGAEYNGAHKVINIGATVQPSEFAKLSIILFSHSLSKERIN